MSLPNCNADLCFAFDLVHDEQNLVTLHFGAQAVTANSMRVMAQALPPSSLLSAVVVVVATSAHVDSLVITTLGRGKDYLDTHPRRLFQRFCKKE